MIGYLHYSFSRTATYLRLSAGRPLGGRSYEQGPLGGLG